MQHDLSQYRTFVFDCDGVILNSNKIKTQAFYEATKHYGHEPAQALVDYHVQNGGISRYVKMDYFLTEIMGKKPEQAEIDDLLTRFSQSVKKGLMTCEVAESLDELKSKTSNANWLIVSGGDQAELRDVFKERELDHYFDGGIFGSPDTKDTILAREIENGNITRPALFLGDSKYDYQAAKTAELDFVFISQWTEFNGWSEFCETFQIDVVEKLHFLWVRSVEKDILLLQRNKNLKFFYKYVQQKKYRKIVMTSETLFLEYGDDGLPAEVYSESANAFIVLGKLVEAKKILEKAVLKFPDHLKVAKACLNFALKIRNQSLIISWSRQVLSLEYQQDVTFFIRIFESLDPDPFLRNLGYQELLKISYQQYFNNKKLNLVTKRHLALWSLELGTKLNIQGYLNELDSLFLSHLYLKGNQLKLALSVALRAFEVMPNSQAIFSRLILVYKSLGNFQAIIELVESNSSKLRTFSVIESYIHVLTKFNYIEKAEEFYNVEEVKLTEDQKSICLAKLSVAKNDWCKLESILEPISTNKSLRGVYRYYKELVRLYTLRETLPLEEEIMAVWTLTKPKITIACICYNHEQYIADALSSFLMQKTDHPFEIIVHDDASTDNSPKIIQEFQNRYPNIIKPILQKINQYSQGIKPVVNVLSMADGRYIAICEGDDYWLLEDKIQCQVELLESHPDVFSCHHDFLTLDQIQEVAPDLSSSKEEVVNLFFTSEDQIYKKSPMIRIPTLMYRNVGTNLVYPKEFYNQANGDQFLSSYFGLLGKTIYMKNYCGSVFRSNPNSSWTPLDSKSKVFLRVSWRAWLALVFLRLEKYEYFKHHAKIVMNAVTKIDLESFASDPRVNIKKGLEAFDLIKSSLNVDGK